MELGEYNMKKYIALFVMAITLLVNVPITQAWEGRFSVAQDEETKQEFADEHYNVHNSDYVILRDKKDNKTGTPLFLCDTNRTVVFCNAQNGYSKMTTVAYDLTGHYSQQEPLLIEFWFQDTNKLYVRISKEIGNYNKCINLSPQGIDGVRDLWKDKEFFPDYAPINLFQVLENYGKIIDAQTGE